MHRVPEATLYQLVDFEKAFDNVHREGPWRILRANGMPQQIIDIIKGFCNYFTCRVAAKPALK